jgi:hypothetical protein
MFEVMFGAITALNQVGAFAAALVLAGIGGLLVGTAIYWRLHALRVTGEVIGVRRNGNCYNAVYRYVTPSGESIEATSQEGSSSLADKATGAQVPLLVIPEKPGEVLEARHHVFTVIGAVLLAAGLGLFWFAATRWRVGPMTFVIGALFLLRFALWAKRTFAPNDKSLTGRSLRDLMAQRAGATVTDAPVLRAEDVGVSGEPAARPAANRKTLRLLAPLFLIAGVGLVVLGVRQTQAQLRLESAGVRAAGAVTDLISSHDSNGYTYYARVSFSDRAGRRIGFKDRVGSNPPLYHPGEAVTVLYLPGEPGGAIIDRGFWNWLPQCLLFAFGAALAVLGAALLRGRRTELALGTVPGGIG